MKLWPVWPMHSTVACNTSSAVLSSITDAAHFLRSCAVPATGVPMLLLHQCRELLDRSGVLDHGWYAVLICFALKRFAKIGVKKLKLVSPLGRRKCPVDNVPFTIPDLFHVCLQMRVAQRATQGCSASCDSDNRDHTSAVFLRLDGSTSWACRCIALIRASAVHGRSIA